MGTQLFERGLLEQETGVLADRWGQPGSTPVNAFTSVTATLHTVTTGKKLYITCITVVDNGAIGVAELKDGGAGGTVKIKIRTPADTTAVVVLSTPLIFETDVLATTGADVTITGWEE